MKVIQLMFELILAQNQDYDLRFVMKMKEVLCETVLFHIVRLYSLVYCGSEAISM